MRIIDNDRPAYRFVFEDLVFFEGLLDYYFNSFNISENLKRIFKTRASIRVVIKAILHAFSCHIKFIDYDFQDHIIDSCDWMKKIKNLLRV